MIDGFFGNFKCRDFFGCVWVCVGVWRGGGWVGELGKYFWRGGLDLSRDWVLKTI